MKKFFKLSAALILLGVLAVGCIKNEPSPGIEEMRMQKAAVYKAYAEVLTAHKVLIEAQATLKEAEASLKLAEAERVKAEAEVIKAHKALIEAKAAYENAETDYQKQKWALKIADMELDLVAKEAAVQQQVEDYALRMAALKQGLFDAQVAYEKAVAAFEAWKLENETSLADAILVRLDAVTENIQATMREIAKAQIDLNVAYAAYDNYVNVDLEKIEMIVLGMEQEARRLECAIAFQEGLVATYTNMYDKYHTEYDAFINELQAQIAVWQEENVNYDMAILDAKKDILDLETPVADAFDALTANQTVRIHAWDDFIADPTVHIDVYSGGARYNLRAPLDVIAGIIRTDIAVIEDTRADFDEAGNNPQGKVDVEATKAQYAAATKAAYKAYQDNWTSWQSTYTSVQLATGSKYVAWKEAYDAYVAENALYVTNAANYKAAYETAFKAVQEYMKGLDEDWESGTLGQFFGTGQLSAVLGGITFNATNMLNAIWGDSKVFEIIDAFLTYLSGVDYMNDRVETIKGVMDGTYNALPAFYDITEELPFNGVKPIETDVMTDIYTEEAGKTINDLTLQDYHTWLFLYWLFEDKTATLGANGIGAIFQINPNSYKDAPLQFTQDFFGTYDAAAYSAALAWPAKYYSDEKDAYFKAVAALGTKENAMFKPYGRTWTANYKSGKANSDNPADLASVTAAPASYTPPTYPDVTPADASEFYFRLEDNTTPYYPALEGTLVYAGEGCDLYVSYTALKSTNNYCGSITADWAGDLLLWPYDNTYTSGHFAFAYKAKQQEDGFIAKYNHVVNGDYAKLQAALETAAAELEAAYATAYSTWYQLFNQLYTLDYMSTVVYPYYIDYNNYYIGEYQSLMAKAMKGHEEGAADIDIDGIDELLVNAEEGLAALKIALAQCQTNIDSWVAGYGVYFPFESAEGITFADNFSAEAIAFADNFIKNLTAQYAAEIDALLLEIDNLMTKQTFYENQRQAIIDEAFGNE